MQGVRAAYLPRSITPPPLHFPPHCPDLRYSAITEVVAPPNNVADHVTTVSFCISVLRNGARIFRFCDCSQFWFDTPLADRRYLLHLLPDIDAFLLTRNAKDAMECVRICFNATASFDVNAVSSSSRGFVWLTFNYLAFVTVMSWTNDKDKLMRDKVHGTRNTVRTVNCVFSYTIQLYFIQNNYWMQ